MAREDGTFKENPAGVSSVLFYHATIIIHGESFQRTRFSKHKQLTTHQISLEQTGLTQTYLIHHRTSTSLPFTVRV